MASKIGIICERCGRKHRLIEGSAMAKAIWAGKPCPACAPKSITAPHGMTDAQVAAAANSDRAQGLGVYGLTHAMREEQRRMEAHPVQGVYDHPEDC